MALTRRLTHANPVHTRSSLRARAHALIVTLMTMAPAPSLAPQRIIPSLSAHNHPLGNFILLFVAFCFSFYSIIIIIIIKLTNLRKLLAVKTCFTTDEYRFLLNFHMIVLRKVKLGRMSIRGPVFGCGIAIDMVVSCHVFYFPMSCFNFIAPSRFRLWCFMFSIFAINLGLNLDAVRLNREMGNTQWRWTIRVLM